EYSELFKYLSQTTKYFDSGSLLEKNLSYSVYKNYHQWFLKDSENHYQLLQYIYKTSLSSGNIKYQDEVQQMINNYVDNVMDFDNFNVMKAQDFWQAIKSSNNLYQELSNYYFDEEKVKTYSVSDLDEDIAGEAGILLISLFNDYLNGLGLNKDLLEKHSSWGSLLFKLYELVLKESKTSKIKSLVTDYDEGTMNFITMKFSKSRGSKAPVTKTWISLYGSEIDKDNLYKQCQSMLESGVHPDAVELLLTTYMERQQETNDELLRSFKLLFDYLDNDKNVGVAFFEKYVDIVCQNKNKYRELGRLLDFVRKEDFPKSIQRNLGIRIDKMIPSIIESRNEERFVMDFFEWCKPLQEIGSHTLKAKYYLDVQQIRSSNLDAFIERVHNQKLSIGNDEKAYVDVYIDHIAPLIERAEVLNNACYMFETDNNTRMYIVEKYFKTLAKRTKRDYYAIATLGYYCVVKIDYEELSVYAKKQGKMDLAENFKEETWDECIDMIKEKDKRNAFKNLRDEISDMSSQIKPTDKLKKGLRNIFKK
ncbi:MAG: hypothetical protein LUG46_03295, partial [Erysipelotrichaceae bacterium]|nr:hypothetical protein [Erysipelotrichaceae bacterium]